MAIETTKEMLKLNQIVGQKVEIITAETDCVVPDIKPDILNTISTSGTVCIYKKEVLDGKVRIEGCANIYVIYIADDENSSIRSLSTNVDFSKYIEIENAKEEMTISEETILKSIECRVLNGRKINVKTILETKVIVSSNEEVEFVKEISQIKDIQMLNQNMTLSSLLGRGTTKVYAKDTLVIDSTDDLSEIMQVNTQIKNKDIKVSYNKVLAKADAEVRILYMTVDGRVNSCVNLIPIMGFIDMPNVTDDNLCDTNYEIRNIIIKPNNVEEHSVYVEIEMELECNVYETKNVNIIQDLYSPSSNLVYKQKKLNCLGNRSINRNVCNIYQKQFIDELGDNKLYQVDARPIINNTTILKDRILYEGEIELKFIYATQETTKISTKTVEIPFDYTMECIGIKQNSQVDTTMEITTQDFTIQADKSIDIKIDIQFSSSYATRETINVIDEINIEEDRKEEKYSLVIYFVKPGDSLWKIAKKFKSTVEAISKVNGIEDVDKINIGEQLYIPMAI